MSRMKMYMVYNPKKDKPNKYYSDYTSALADAQELNKKENTDILVLKVVGKVENEKLTISASEQKIFTKKTIEIVE